jgi:hypothetical protein
MGLDSDLERGIDAMDTTHAAGATAPWLAGKASSENIN